MYFKNVIDGFVVSISINHGQVEISKAEYDTILALSRSQPTAPSGSDYKLRADTLEWELVELPPEPVDPDVDDTEAIGILLGGAE